jgi:hypothetical protein
VTGAAHYVFPSQRYTVPGAVRLMEQQCRRFGSSRRDVLTYWRGGTKTQRRMVRAAETQGWDFERWCNS